MLVHEMMSAPEVLLAEAVPVRVAALRLAEHRCDSAPVVGGEDVFVGIVSESDLLADYFASRRSDVGGAASAPPTTAVRRVGDAMTRAVVTAAEDEDACALSRRMVETHIRCVPVLRLGRVVGVVRRRDIMLLMLRPDDAVRADVEAELRRRFPDMPDLDVAVCDGSVAVTGASEARVRRCVEAMQREIPGIRTIVFRHPTATDGRRAGAADPVLRPASPAPPPMRRNHRSDKETTMGSTVADAMTTAVTTVTKDTGYKELVDTLLEQRVSAVPVVDAKGRLLGVVSEEDLLHKVEFKEADRDSNYWPPLRARLRSRLTGGGVQGDSAGEKAAAATAADLMTSPAITTTSDASVVAAARLMERRGVKRLPVVDARNALVGIISRRDLLRVFLQDDETIAASVQREIDFVTSTAKDSEITATVQDGAVMLTGMVDHRSSAHMLGRLVNRTEGVVSVDNQVTWRTDDLVRPYAGL